MVQERMLHSGGVTLRACGRRYFLMLSADPAAKAKSWGCAAIARMDFLWYVSVDRVLPLRRSHIFTVLSWLPVMICGSADAAASVTCCVTVWGAIVRF